MERSRYVDLFLSESREHIGAVNRLLLALERDPTGPGPVEELFRALHTLKGMSAAMGYGRSAGLAHALEHLLDQIRGGALAVDAELTEALFQGVDALERAMEAEAGGAASPGAEPVLELLSELAPDDAALEKAGALPAADSADGHAADAPEPGLRVTAVIQASAPLPAVRAMLLLRRARELGEVREVEPSEERLAAGDFRGTLGFRLRTEAGPEEVRTSLSAVGDVAHLQLDEEAPPAAGGGTRAPGARGADAAGGGPVVRVRQDRLDALVNQVGELVIARDRLDRLVRQREDEELGEAADRLAALIGELRDEVMGVRMVAVGEVFDRFPRLVRDAARSLGKRVQFSILGRDVELDRSMVNELGDLLVHLLRNAADHGIEAPEDRVAAGKPEIGEVRLVARRRHAQVEVRVEDDGRGVDRERVRQSAAAQGWLDEARDLSGDDVLHLITRPGFTTATRVTDVSGRGVGLDVVRTRVLALGGSLEVESEPGRGTAFTLRLPLSLAIVRALQVEVAGEVYSLPLSGVEEVAETDAAAPQGEDDGEVLWLRGDAVPLARLDAALGLPRRPPDDRPLPVVVVRGGERRVGLVVHALLGQHEAVLKPFDATRDARPFFAGATLLSDGQPSLILDVPRLCSWLEQHPEHGRPDAVGLRTTTMTETLC